MKLNILGMNWDKYNVLLCSEMYSLLFTLIFLATVSVPV